MASALRFVCSSCAHAIEAWDDGNPYYLDDNGKKQYAYHPDHERLALCIGNDDPHLCLSCGSQFMVDSREPITACPACSSQEIAPTWELAGKPCPFCASGMFEVDPDFMAIS